MAENTLRKRLDTCAQTTCGEITSLWNMKSSSKLGNISCLRVLGFWDFPVLKRAGGELCDMWVGKYLFWEEHSGKGNKEEGWEKGDQQRRVVGWLVRVRGARIVGNKIGKLGRYEGKKSLSEKNAREKGEGNLNPERGNWLIAGWGIGQE